MEIINYTYPHELLDEDGGFGEHVQRCVGLLKDYIIICHRRQKQPEGGSRKRLWKMTAHHARKWNIRRWKWHRRPRGEKSKARNRKESGKARGGSQIQGTVRRDKSPDRRAPREGENYLRRPVRFGLSGPDSILGSKDGNCFLIQNSAVVFLQHFSKTGSASAILLNSVMQDLSFRWSGFPKISSAVFPFRSKTACEISTRRFPSTGWRRNSLASSRSFNQNTRYSP